MTERRRVRSWQGLEFNIEIRDGWAKLGFFYHPQIANFFMRYGLPRMVRLEMEILHELGHIQSVPFVFAYYFPFYLMEKLHGAMSIFITTLGMFLFWEVLAECYVLWSHKGYFGAYKHNVSILTITFWLTVWFIVLIPFFLLL